MTVILGPDFARKRGLPFAKLADVQPHAPDTRAPIGRTPWRVVANDQGMAAILDRDGCTISIVKTRQIAEKIASAINSFAPLHADWVFATDILRAAQAELRMGTPEDAVKRVGEMLDGALTPGDSPH